MSALRRFIYTPASRRTYSYFSSKSGGGRYFNSAKAPKSAVVAAKNATVDPTNAEAQKENVQGVPPNNGVPTLAEAQSTGPSPQGLSSSSSAPPSSEASSSGAPPTTSSFTNVFAEITQNHIPHNVISAKDFKMHQFFSLHRPLLLISQPTSIFRSIPPEYPLFAPLQSDAEKETQRRLALGLDASPDPFIDADAEAARQLTRALTMSKAGPAISWEHALKTLGLDVSKDADRVNLQQQFDREWEEVLLDSTKRKRRKKMKKHK
ncbi:hypothetical protein NLJ89_g525 [Agrocybe chaxingu]|uniref:Uncharacterized protein n=1 Tax=Agrocybe chaxingu TaxID=84603 RepID=A0A9W8N1X4_9AGAR|nr:hypothetical protein NLJ89_g525 [Agrocybe chaxingu]